MQPFPISVLIRVKFSILYYCNIQFCSASCDQQLWFANTIIQAGRLPEESSPAKLAKHQYTFQMAKMESNIAKMTHFFIFMDELTFVVTKLLCEKLRTNIENIILHYFSKQKSQMCQSPPGAAPNITANTSIKCKPVDSQTRQEVKADKQKKLNNVTEQVNKYAKIYSGFQSVQHKHVAPKPAIQRITIINHSCPL